MISLHYGLPKIIQDEDDDNDLPIDCDIGNISLTQLPLPLPGEQTRFASFLVYVRLSKILSMVLKDLYTTTRRRNAEDAMVSLDRELSMWLSLAEPVIGELWDPSERENDAPSWDFSSLWLHAMYRLAVIYIHRPALTFEPTEPKFKDSLGIYSKAASALIQLLIMSTSERRLFYALPIGPSIVFQCGILNLFAVWYTPSSALDYKSPVESAASLLEHLEKSIFYKRPTPEEGAIGTRYNQPLSHAAWVLRHLSAITSQIPDISGSPAASSSHQNDSSQWACNPAPSYTAPAYHPDSRGQHNDVVTPSIQLGLQAPQEQATFLDPNFPWGLGGGIDYFNQMYDSLWNFLPSVDDMMGDVMLDLNQPH
ncbi:hypothetical protein ONS95_000117 [Cadophora gregata]|uniref:uncharacterized protein n=1 Tax=Cadophora gregata TaxID=51156 RepID=UPI0026DAB2BF|nr:uncharacterized protein ONS95_000117 [Cadophora gregata]KAK0115613.1 hypothetical protein ONS96_014060 [Cadophora gregata f. sp. sojae]KAK0128133.1 hypothetical protein ONS95_000117 [Cadophora gregata]